MMYWRLFLELMPRQIQVMFRINFLHIKKWRRVNDQWMWSGLLWPWRHQYLSSALWPCHCIRLHAIRKQHSLSWGWFHHWHGHRNILLWRHLKGRCTSDNNVLGWAVINKHNNNVNQVMRYRVQFTFSLGWLEKVLHNSIETNRIDGVNLFKYLLLYVPWHGLISWLTQNAWHQLMREFVTCVGVLAANISAAIDLIEIIGIGSRRTITNQSLHLIRQLIVYRERHVFGGIRYKVRHKGWAWLYRVEISTSAYFHHLYGRLYIITVRIIDQMC